MTQRQDPTKRQRATTTETRQIIQLPWTAIRTNGGTQSRLQINQDTVTEYADAMRNNSRFPPLLCFYDGNAYWLADGFHRHTAHQQAHSSQSEITVEVRQGTRRDAILYAVGANADHGLRRTNTDKQNAILMLLRDEEWCQWSDREIARRTKTTHPTVARLRTQLQEQEGHAQPTLRKTAAGRTIQTAEIGGHSQERWPTPIDANGLLPNTATDAGWKMEEIPGKGYRVHIPNDDDAHTIGPILPLREALATWLENAPDTYAQLPGDTATNGNSQARPPAGTATAIENRPDVRTSSIDSQGNKTETATDRLRSLLQDTKPSHDGWLLSLSIDDELSNLYQSLSDAWEKVDRRLNSLSRHGDA